MSIIDPISQPLSEYSLPPAPAESLVRLTVEQYHDMARQGIFSDDEGVELLEGLLVRKMTVSPAHRRATYRLQNALRKWVPDSHYVESPSSVTLAASEPEPDAIVVRGSVDDYADRHPGPGDVALIVEVSDSSLRRDRRFKKAIYAKAAIPVYWIVNLIDRQIEVYSQPTGPADQPDFGDHRDYPETREVPLVIDGREIARIPVRELI
jgi:Uma2 family endonuclease